MRGRRPTWLQGWRENWLTSSPLRPRTQHAHTPYPRVFTNQAPGKKWPQKPPPGPGPPPSPLPPVPPLRCRGTGDCSGRQDGIHHHASVTLLSFLLLSLPGLSQFPPVLPYFLPPLSLNTLSGLLLPLNNLSTALLPSRHPPHTLTRTISLNTLSGLLLPLNNLSTALLPSHHSPHTHILTHTISLTLRSLLSLFHTCHHPQLPFPLPSLPGLPPSCLFTYPLYPSCLSVYPPYLSCLFVYPLSPFLH